ncbi:S-layer homology domain-containing protein [Oscillibacter sp.]|uniref:S-layer homology domain-containing protein n=1 Tax=Oscillibacter sp. TaxID=1945593 RepID=UPI001B57A3AA|nr:S-layer homology domain-containing protein [Oscillibacter sp.]MBP3509466.1 S-layer homology domain-containing protein [Oscillibacter sp.]
MKKFLSLVLALVMTMSLVTISAGAKDFTDADKVTYTEAVDVLSAVKVVDGYTDGAFKPTTQLNRGQAAKILCNMILGPTTASALKADAAPFKDVAADNTFAAYIAYCAKEGIIDGYTDGTFRPTAPLTGYAFMKLLLGALGYDKDVEGYNGPNWSINVAKRALNIGLDDGLVEDFDGTKIVTREEACLFALNTMESDMVEYDTKTSISVGGAEVVIAGSKAEPVEYKNGKYDGNIDPDGVLQFAEKYFTNLKAVPDTDDFARPATTWKVKAETVGTYTITPDLTYTKKVESGDVYKDLGLSSTISSADVDVYVDGEYDSSVAIKKGDETKIGKSGNGVRTEVYYFDNDDTVVVTQVNTYVGEIVKTVAATAKKDAYVVVSLDSHPTGVTANQEFETDEEFDDETKVLYTYSLSADEVKSVAVAEVVSGTATRIENSKNNTDENKAITVEDTAYKFSEKSAGVTLEDASVNVDYDVYLDEYGYAIFVKEIEEIGNYALLMDYQDKSTFSTNKALLVFTDGTEKIVETAKNYKNGDYALALGTIVTYKEDNGVYTLKPVAQTIANGTVASVTLGGTYPNITTHASTNQDFNLTNDKAGIVIAKDSTDTYYTINKNGSKTTSSGVTGSKSVNANSNTVFVVYNQADDDYSVYTGIKNAPTIQSTASKTASSFTYVKNGMTKVMFIFVPDSSIVDDKNNKMIFLAGESVSNLIHTNNSDYFEFNAVVNGEITTAKVASDVIVDTKPFTTNALVAELNGLFASYSVDKYGVITRLTSYDYYGKGTPAGNAKEAINGNNSATLKADDASGTEQSVTIATPANAVGIAKRSADYTVTLGTTSGVNATITVDDAAKIYYVDKDGKITESSYNAIAQDGTDYAYAVVQDYLVKYLFVEEVEEPTATYGVTFAGANFTVNGAAPAPIEAEEKGDDVSFTVEPVAGYQIDRVQVSGVNVPVKDGVYTVKNVKSLITVTVTTSAAPVTEAVVSLASSVAGKPARFTFKDANTGAQVASANTGKNVTLVPGVEYLVEVTFSNDDLDAIATLTCSRDSLTDVGGWYYTAGNGDTMTAGIETVVVTLNDTVTAKYTLGNTYINVAVPADGKVPYGATVTLALKGTSSWTSGGTAFAANALGTRGTVTADATALVYDCYKVTVSGDYIATKDVYLKSGVAGNVAFDSANGGNWSGAATVINPAGWTFVKDTDNSTAAKLVGTLKANSLTSDTSVTLNYDAT